jgi:hypothetical protein
MTIKSKFNLNELVWIPSLRLPGIIDGALIRTSGVDRYYVKYFQGGIHKVTELLESELIKRVQCTSKKDRR